VKKLREQTFKIHLTAFLLMILPPLPMYLAAQSGNTVWLFVLLGLVILGNFLVVIAG
jgi:hypothetical protein